MDTVEAMRLLKIFKEGIRSNLERIEWAKRSGRPNARILIPIYRSNLKVNEQLYAEVHEYLFPKLDVDSRKLQ